MSDAWTILVDGSTIDDGDAWQHLGAQGGGTGGEVEILVDAIRTADVLTTLAATISTEPLTAEVLTVASASVQIPTYTADISATNEAEL